MNNLTKHAYQKQKWLSKKRDISFDLTYEQWLEIWESSGFAHLRGRGRGKYCMARHGDIGPYNVDNVSIISFEQNLSDGHKGKSKPAEQRDKMSQARIGRKDSAETILRKKEASRLRWSN
tara:strand:+ start:87 stop:446 length:360 start_codon:yes stop_codon:yes gene_type:complete